MKPLSLSAATAASTAWWFDLGDVAGAPVFAARGELGRIWRLDTDRGSWAVKESLVPTAEAAAAQDVRFQLIAHSAGIPLPLPRLTRGWIPGLPGRRRTRSAPRSRGFRHGRRAIDPGEPTENRERSRTRLAHILRQPITLEFIRGLLELVADDSDLR